MKSQGMAQRQVALAVLSKVAQQQAFSNLALKEELKQAKLDKRDAAFVSSLVYTTLENLLRIDYIIALFSTAPRLHAAIRDILRLGACQILFMGVRDAAAIDTSVELARLAGKDALCGFVNAVLRKIAARKDRIPYPDAKKQPLEHLSVYYSMPKPVVRLWLDAYGYDFCRSMLAYKPETEGMTLRVNRLKTTAEQAVAELRDMGVEVSPAKHRDALRVVGMGDLTEQPIFVDGLVTPMGEASMLVCDAMDVGPGQRVLDACCAPGGKTALLAQRMDDKGSLLAWDKYPHRVRLAHYTAKRLGATIVHTDAQDATMPKPELYAAMDAVLVDAPCSGLGVIGSKPDIVLNKTEKDFAALAQLQGSILDACCRYVRPGGKLVYSTCTISPIENQQVVQAFLQSHGEFKLADNDFLPASLSLRKGESGPGVQLFPHLTGMDGFYIAKMERAL